MVALSCNFLLLLFIVVSPFTPEIAMPVTDILCPVILITKVPWTAEASFAVAITVTSPFSMAVTRPAELTVASPVPLIIDQVTVLSVAFAGDTVAITRRNPWSDPMEVCPFSPLMLIPVTCIFWLEIAMSRAP